MKYLYVLKDKSFKTCFDVSCSPLDPDTFLDSLKSEVKHGNYERYKGYLVKYVGVFDNESSEINTNIDKWSFDVDEYFESLKGDNDGK